MDVDKVEVRSSSPVMGSILRNTVGHPARPAESLLLVKEDIRLRCGAASAYLGSTDRGGSFAASRQTALAVASRAFTAPPLAKGGTANIC
jgi:hypothetical protein